jgi:serine/threonine-protein kinase
MKKFLALVGYAAYNTQQGSARAQIFLRYFRRIMMLRFRALGRPIVEGPEGTVGGAAAQRKPLALLALLAVAGARGMSRDKILAYLWPETPTDRAAHRLTQVLYSLRHQLQTDDLFLGSADLRLNPDLISTDVTDFHQALADHSPDRAVGVYNGPFLDGFFMNGAAEFENWVDEERADLDRRYRKALEILAEQAMASADEVATTHWCGRLAQADPLNAQVALRYMEALARTGDRAGAIRFGRSHEVRLREELDADPDPAVVAAVERLQSQATDKASVAVLPFLNMSREHENDYFSDGMAEELTNALTHVPGLRVASRTSAFAFKGKDLDLREIGARLGVRSVVEGSVRKVGNRIRITAQLIDAVTGYHMCSETFERTVSDVFTLQEEISQAIVRALPLTIDSRAGGSLVRPPTALVEAYTLYLRGRYFAMKRTPDTLRLAVEYFEQALDLDPQYALAHAGVGECYTLLGFEEFGDLPPGEAMPRAKASLERALNLQSDRAEGHSWLGAIAFLFEYDWPKAEAAFLRAIELKPTYSLAHTWYAVFLSAMGRHEEALARIHQAEQLDPLAVTIHTVVGHTYYLARRFDEALQRYLAILEMDPDNLRLHAWMARAHYATGQFEHGLRVLDSAIGRIGRRSLLLVEQGRFLAALGRREEACCIIKELERLRQLGYVPTLFTASIHRALGNYEEVFSCFEDAVEQRSGHLPFLGVEPSWDPVREDPRFQGLVERFHLPRSITEARTPSLAIR